MAQIIKHRRGSIAALKDVTANVGELVMGTGSIGDLNAPVLFIGNTAVAGGYKPVSKIYQGTTVPTISVGSHGSTMDGLPFYSTGTKTLYILDKDGNSAINLTGNIEGNTISGVTINNLTGTTINLSNSGNSALNITGDIVQTGSFYTSGDIVLRGNINIGDNLTGDTLTLNSEISSSMIPDSNNNFDLGTSSKFWRNLYVSGTAFINTLEAQNIRNYNSLFGTSSSGVTTFVVTVSSKTSNHRYFGTGSGSGYFIDGIESPFLTLLPGKTYRFSQTDGSNSSHQILFYYESNRTTQYTTNVTTSGSAGSAGAYTEIVVTDTTPIVLHYQCVNHPYMGNSAQFNSNVLDTPHQVNARNGIIVTGSAVLNNSLEVKGTTSLNSTLTVTGSATFKNNVNISGDTSTTGSEFINQNLFVGGNGKVTGSFEVVGATSLDSTLTVTGSVTLKDTLSVSGTTTINGLTTINDDAVVNGVLTVTGNTQLGGNLYVSGNLEILGSSTSVTIQSQTVEIDDNIIRMNAYSPFLRYAGFEVNDSGSVGVSGSVLWDSTNDYWMFVSTSGQSSKLVGTTAGTFGSEVSLTTNTIPKSTGANNIGDSLLTDSATTLSYNTNKFQVTASDGATLIAGNVTVSAAGGADAGTKTSRVVFRNSSNVLGYVSATESTDVLDGILGYKNSDGALKFSTVIDGGTY